MGPELFVLLVLAAVEKTGSAALPVLTFRPNLSPIFKGGYIKMTCDFKPKEKDYGWLHNNVQLSRAEVYEISEAQSRQSGNYQCQTKDGTKSQMVTLNVTDDHVILQTTPYIHEGDRLMLTCQHASGFNAKRSIFYKDKAVLKDWSDGNQYTKPGIKMDESGTYSCSKEVSRGSEAFTLTAYTSIHVRELFTTPKIQVTRNKAKGGDNVTLTCQTNVSPYKPAMGLLYAFYKDGENIHKFSSANQYQIPAAQQGHPGKYSCAVTPTISSLTKKSKEIDPKNSAHTMNIAGLALSECVLIISYMFIFVT